MDQQCSASACSNCCDAKRCESQQQCKRIETSLRGSALNSKNPFNFLNHRDIQVDACNRGHHIPAYLQSFGGRVSNKSSYVESFSPASAITTYSQARARDSGQRPQQQTKTSSPHPPEKKGNAASFPGVQGCKRSSSTFRGVPRCLGR